LLIELPQLLHFVFALLPLRALALQFALPSVVPRPRSGDSVPFLS
jgi:hypothetical protein